VEAASKYFFRHSAKDITPAEAAILVIQLVRPGLYSPIRNPNSARKIQEIILSDMVSKGFITQEQSDQSFNQYWTNYDYKRDSLSTAFFDRKDKAPFFSEYIRNLVDENLLGPHDIYRDGLTIHTTLDLNIQKVADATMVAGIADTNRKFHLSTENQGNVVDTEVSPLLDMISLGFNLPDFRASTTQYLRDAKSVVTDTLSPTIDLTAKLFGLEEVQDAALQAYQSVIDLNGKTNVEGALITLENSTGYIKAMVGGTQFDHLNQFNRAVQANVQPGSSFKPLFYSAAIDSKKFTPATMIMDAPTVFTKEDGTPYTPLNFKGEWKGPVLLRYALAHSMNVPAIQVLAGIGFDAAIDRASKLLDLTDQDGPGLRRLRKPGSGCRPRGGALHSRPQWEHHHQPGGRRRRGQAPGRRPDPADQPPDRLHYDRPDEDHDHRGYPGGGRGQCRWAPHGNGGQDRYHSELVRRVDRGFQSLHDHGDLAGVRQAWELLGSLEHRRRRRRTPVGPVHEDHP
jgi:penicillin-binding protein 1A